MIHNILTIKKIFFLILISISPLNVLAQKDNMLSVKEEIHINVSAEKVWDIVNKFNDLGAWHPAVKSTKVTLPSSFFGFFSESKVGSVRVLTLVDGGTIKEELLAFSSKDKTFKYSILEGVLPVSNYVSTLSVKPDGNNNSIVVWKSNFNPKPDSDDIEAVKTITSVYRIGLDNLKRIAESNKKANISPSSEIAFGSFKFKPYSSNLKKFNESSEPLKKANISPSSEIAFGSFKFKPF